MITECDLHTHTDTHTHTHTQKHANVQVYTGAHTHTNTYAMQYRWVVYTFESINQVLMFHVLTTWLRDLAKTHE